MLRLIRDLPRIEATGRFAYEDYPDGPDTDRRGHDGRWPTHIFDSASYGPHTEYIPIRPMPDQSSAESKIVNQNPREESLVR